MSRTVQLWFEPGRADIDLGLRAQVADPVWFLTRQWQLGEHRGEDASSPVVVSVEPHHVPLTYDGSPDRDPTVVPAEALLEAGPDDWWTIGRRVRLGRAAAPHLPPGTVGDLLLPELPRPYEALTGAPDGWRIWSSHLLAGHPVFAEVPVPATDNWSATGLSYSAGFSAADTTLTVARHQGGDVDWFSVDGEPGAAVVPGDVEPRQVIPARLTYPGAPNPRWWQLEDHAVDIGGFAPDRSHLATMLLLDVVLAHSDDWFSFVVPPPEGEPRAPSSGVLVRLGTVTVRDSFDEDWALTAPTDGWSMFRTRGLDQHDLVVWPVAVAPHPGPVLDDVSLGVDEDANLAWAVELRADGQQLREDADATAAVAETTPTGSQVFTYLPSTTVPRHWHPYERLRPGDPGADDLAEEHGRSGTWRQGLLRNVGEPDPEVSDPRFRRGPTSTLVGGPSDRHSSFGRGHDLAPDAVPSSGVRLRRRARLARDTNGRPVLWVERSAHPQIGPPTSHLRFDVLSEQSD